MSLTDQSPVKQLMGAMAALHFAAGQAERQAASLLWDSSANPADLEKAIQCIFEALQAFQDALKKCKSGETGDKGGKSGGNTGPLPPKCGIGFHFELGVCVPDAP
jgi:hypothetical protein